jgi:hypothetical protein
VNVVGHGMACMPASNYGGVWVTLITLTRLVYGASHDSVLDTTGTHPHAPAPEPPEHAEEDDASSSSDSSSDSDSSDSGASSSSLTESSSSSSEVDDAVRENAIFKHVTQSSVLPLGDVFGGPCLCGEHAVGTSGVLEEAAPVVIHVACESSC